MHSILVEPDLDVLEGLSLRVARALKILSDFLLERLEEALDDSVIIAVATPAHAADETADVEDGLIVLAGVGLGFKQSSQRAYVLLSLCDLGLPLPAFSTQEFFADGC